MPSLLCCVIVFTLSTHTDPYLSVLEKPKRSLLKGSTKIWFYVNKHILKEFQWIQLNWKYNLKLSEWLKAFHLLQWLDVTFRCYFGSVPKRKKIAAAISNNSRIFHMDDSFVIDYIWLFGFSHFRTIPIVHTSSKKISGFFSQQKDSSQ